MWWSDKLRPWMAAAAMVAAALPLTGCSFSPVYGGGGALAGQQTLALNYAEPNNRLEQIIYQELRLRLGSSDLPNAPQAVVSASAVALDPTIGAPVNLYDTIRMSVTATLTITREGAEPLVLTRTATADYTTTDQILASTAAADEASARAAKAAAESLRLAVLAALSR